MSRCSSEHKHRLSQCTPSHKAYTTHKHRYRCLRAVCNVNHAASCVQKGPKTPVRCITFNLLWFAFSGLSHSEPQIQTQASPAHWPHGTRAHAHTMTHTHTLSLHAPTHAHAAVTLCILKLQDVLNGTSMPQAVLGLWQATGGCRRTDHTAIESGGWGCALILDPGVLQGLVGCQARGRLPHQEALHSRYLPLYTQTMNLCRIINCIDQVLITAHTILFVPTTFMRLLSVVYKKCSVSVSGLARLRGQIGSCALQFLWQRQSCLY